jgi:hypothetical protein
MDRDGFSSMLNRMADGWVSKDYDSVVGYFSEGVYYSDPLNYKFYDRDSLLGFFSDDDGKPQSCVFHGSVFDDERQVGTAEYTYEGTFRYHGTVWIELKDDKIISWREYQHRSEKNWEEFWDIK